MSVVPANFTGRILYAQKHKQKKKQATGALAAPTGNSDGLFPAAAFGEGFIHRFLHMKVHRQVKDHVFRFLFDKDRKALLELYNALNGSNYQDPEQLKVVTLEGAVYVTAKNDLAFIIAGVLNLYEHQSTLSPNLPLRFLIYLSQEYQKLPEQDRQSLYGSSIIPLPSPKCVVFYNGERDIPDESVMKLSDAYMSKDVDADVELRVRLLNVNYGHNLELMQKCQVLEEYAAFAEQTKRFTKEIRDQMHMA